MEDITAIARDVRSWVLTNGGVVNSTVQAAALAAASERCGGELPNELTSILRVFDGMPEERWDALPNLLRFLPAAELRTVSEEFPTVYHAKHQSVIFADYSLSACLFAVDLDAPGAVYALALEEPGLVASSLGGFLKAMLGDPHSIMDW
jgi:hypothetical protein